MHRSLSPPLLSIVIPTKDRQEYALSAICSLLRIPAADLEVVVQDNSTTRRLEQLLEGKVKDSRLVYHYTSSPLSIVGNFEASLEAATGEYICFIGDDDGVNGEIIEAARWAKINGVDALKPSTSVHYLWPSSGLKPTRFANASQESGLLTIYPFTGKVTAPDMERELRTLARKGGQEYLSTELPKLYHGIVRRECLEQIKKKNRAASYFGGLSPDIYAAISIAEVADKAISIDYPLTLPGACPKSGSVASAKGTHTGSLEDAPHFQHRGEYEWDELVPRYYSVATIWADSARAAFRDAGRDDLLSLFNIPYLSACCAWRDSDYRKIIFRDMFRALRISSQSSGLGFFRLGYSFLTGPIRLLGMRILNRLKIVVLGDGSVSVVGVRDMVDASEQLTKYLAENGLSFSTCTAEYFSESAAVPKSNKAMKGQGRIT